MSIARPSSALVASPFHSHDCDKCRFLGTASTQNGMPVAADLYYCPKFGEGYIVRYSSREPDYRFFGLDMGLQPSKGSLHALAAALHSRNLPARHYCVTGLEE